MEYTRNSWAIQRRAKRVYNLNIVPHELTTKIEVDLGEGYCLSKTENIVKNPVKSFHDGWVIRMIAEQRPELLISADSTFLCGKSLSAYLDEIEKNQQPVT